MPAWPGTAWPGSARGITGLFIVGVFVLTWIVTLCVRHFGRIEQKWENSGPLPADTPD